MTDTRLHRVWGPPGCGKTTYLAEQARRAAQRFGGRNLIVASLTRAAAAEVAGRDTGIPQRNVGTLHAHAYRALRHPELAETKEGLAHWNASVPSHLRLVSVERDVEWANPEEVGGKSDGERMLAAVGILRAQVTPRDRWPGQLRAFDERWEAWKRDSGRLDFTDLIERAARIPHPIDPRVVFLDEAQDMSALEMALALHWATEAEQTVIVGDPDQCLFEWRGSSQGAFLDPEAASERVLEQSYRVPRAVHAYAVSWIERVRDRPRIAYRPRPADGSVANVWATFNDPRKVLEGIAAQPVGETSMILASCAYMLDPTVKLLRAAGVPFHNPYRKTNGRWNPLAGVGRPLALLRPHPSVWADEARFWTFDDLRRWLDPLEAKGWLVRGTKTDVDGICQQSALGESRKDDTVPIDYIEAMLTATDEGRAAGRALTGEPVAALAWWASKLRAKERPRYEYPLTIAERYGVAALREVPRVIVGTVHSVKGGEADTVYVFPDLSLAAWSGQAGGPGWAHGGEGQHPTIRLFYVAFTRARQHLRLCDAASNLAVELPRPAG